MPLVCITSLSSPVHVAVVAANVIVPGGSAFLGVLPTTAHALVTMGLPPLSSAAASKVEYVGDSVREGGGGGRMVGERPSGQNNGWWSRGAWTEPPLTARSCPVSGDSLKKALSPGATT